MDVQLQVYRKNGEISDPVLDSDISSILKCNQKLKKPKSENSPTMVSIDWKSLVRRRLPVTAWIPHYTFSLLFQDLLAGFTVGLTEIPQAIAYAVVAGLEPQYGLYSGFMDGFLYFVFGTCKDINIGPTAIMALMIQHHVEKMGPDMAVLITFLSGSIIFVLGLLHLGFLVEFFSYPVIAGFTSAAAIQIASSQVKSLLGIPGKGNEFIESWKAVIENIDKIGLWDSILGVSGIVLLIALRQARVYGSRTSQPQFSTFRNLVSKLIWFLSLARNAVVVIIATALAFVLHEKGIQPFKLTGSVGEGLPKVAVPPFSTEFKNQTYNFGDMVSQYGSSIAFIPLIAILEHVAISKAFSKGKTIDATQEMLALGLCNLAGSFVRSMPVTGSFTRTAVNNASGVKTTAGGIVTACMVLLALGLLTSTFYFIPKATLASVVITAMFFLIDYQAVITLWRTKRIDLIPFVVTVVASLLLGLEYGIIIGIATNLVFVLYSSARPPIEIIRENLLETDVFIVTTSRSLQFPSAEFLREKVMQDCDFRKTVVVINGKYISSIDATVAKNFKVLADDLILREQSIVFWNFKRNIMDICIGVDEKLARYFTEGPLKHVIGDLLGLKVVDHNTDHINSDAIGTAQITLSNNDMLQQVITDSTSEPMISRGVIK